MNRRNFASLLLGSLQERNQGQLNSMVKVLRLESSFPARSKSRLYKKRKSAIMQANMEEVFNG
jgi:hypothetical protein